MAEVRSDNAQRDFHTEKKKKDAVTRLVLTAKTPFLNAQVAESQTCKQLFSVTNSLLGKSKVSPLPTNIPAAQLPHFTEKIKQIRQNLDNTPSPHVPTVVPDIATPLVQYQKKRYTTFSRKPHRKPANLTHCQYYYSTKTLISFFQLSQIS